MLRRRVLPALFYLFVLLRLVSGETFFLEKANEFYSQGKLSEAIQYYKNAALNGENPALCYFNMANAYYQLDSLPQSVVYYKACLSYAPEFFRAHLNLGTVYYGLEDMGACIAAVRRALSLEPDNENALFLLASAYRKSLALPEAIATFEQIATAFPRKGEAYIALAEMYRELEDYQTASLWLKKYPADGKNESHVSVMLADLAEKNNDNGKALYFLQQAFDADQSNKWVFYHIIELHKKMNNTRVALEQAKKGLEIMPDFGELALLGGTIAFDLEQYDTAERLYTLARNNGVPSAVVGLENIRVVRMNMAK